MYCSNCGNEVADTAKFCATCGAAVNASESESRTKNDGNELSIPASTNNDSHMPNVVPVLLCCGVITGLIARFLGGLDLGCVFWFAAVSFLSFLVWKGSRLASALATALLIAYVGFLAYSDFSLFHFFANTFGAEVADAGWLISGCVYSLSLILFIVGAAFCLWEKVNSSRQYETGPWSWFVLGVLTVVFAVALINEFDDATPNEANAEELRDFEDDEEPGGDDDIEGEYISGFNPRPCANRDASFFSSNTSIFPSSNASRSNSNTLISVQNTSRKEAQRPSRREIGDAVERNGFVEVYDTDGRYMCTHIGELQGYTSNTISIRNGLQLIVYDSKGRQIRSSVASKR